jgi:hypothetical protein
MNVLYWFQIVHKEPLAVHYFEAGPGGLYCSTEYAQEILPEDVAKTLSPPSTVAKGTRIYYKFDM